MDLQNIKQRFNIIGNNQELNRALDIALQVSKTELSVLITGESGTGKEVFPQIIHQFSARKHGQYIAVNCGALPEGTIDSELFGHRKGAFTGAHDTRAGYFEVADKGTIFLDEVGELPLSTQARLLRVLESGEFMKVGSSEVQKTDVRIIAATNVNLPQAIQNGRFREDLYYRLNTVPISIPPLRKRKEDIHLLFRKFSADFSEKYRMPSISLDNESKAILEEYSWPGNIRQLKNITEQISIIEHDRKISVSTLERYLPKMDEIPMIYKNNNDAGEQSFANERELLYKIIFDLRNDVNELKQWVYTGVRSDNISPSPATVRPEMLKAVTQGNNIYEEDTVDIEDVEDQNQDETLLLQDQEVEAIKKALKKYNNRRKQAAEALGISERTLYRKIKEYNI